MTVAIQAYLLLGRGGFWRVRASDGRTGYRSRAKVAAVVPARDEADVVGEAVRSLASQEHDGPFRIHVVDDHSSDGTGDLARALHEERVTVVEAGPLPKGWAGKVWAMAEGVRRAEEFEPEFILFTDADIRHGREHLAGLLERMADDGYDMVSLMVRLRCRSLAERALVPAFVYFFFLLYPPAWIREERASTAGAAGGCMLVRMEALRRAGGLAAIAGERIDDCALAARVKGAGGRVWLGAAERMESLRAYETFGSMLRMISRSAYTQLRYSPVLLIGTAAGLCLTYLAPLMVLATSSWGWGLAAWVMMAGSFVPVLRLYRRSLCWAPLLPGMAVFYLGATFHSAWVHWRGRGGAWKGRVVEG